MGPSNFYCRVGRRQSVTADPFSSPVLGRLGARPLNLDGSQRLYLWGDQVWRVSDDPGFYREQGDQLGLEFER